MHGWFDPVVVFGWTEGNREKRITDAWLESRGLQCFFTDVVRLYAGEMVYGVQCDFRGNAALPPSQTDADAVRAAFAESQSPGELGYHLALAGDASREDHAVYQPCNK
jgi:hypothetical protein